MRQTDQDAAAVTAVPGTGPARFDDVGTTLEQIFGPATTTAPAAVSPRALPVPVAAASARRGRRVAFGVALAAIAAAAGVAMGVTVFEQDERTLSPPATRSAVVAPAPATVRPSVQPAPQPSVAVANVAVAPVAASVSEAQPDTGRAAIVADRGDVISRDVPPRASRASRRVLVVGPASSRRSGCAGARGPDDFACVVERLDTADRELVEAYASAVDAGVPRAELVRINRRWNRARDRARDDPADAVQSYERLADELWIARRQELGEDD